MNRLSEATGPICATPGLKPGVRREFALTARDRTTRGRLGNLPPIDKAKPPSHALRSDGLSRSDGEDFLLFGGEDLVDLLEVFVVEFLHLSFGILLHVFAETLLDLLLQSVDSLAASVAD